MLRRLSRLLLLAPAALLGSGCALVEAGLAPLATAAPPLGPPVDLPEAVAAQAYAYGPAEGVASDRGAPIDVAAENAGASATLLAGLRAGARPRYPVIVVPGFAADEPAPPALHPRARARLARAARALRERGALVVLVSGGNVHPDGTPFNEALEMKRVLVEEHGLSPEQVAIDPYARHSTTNLRNAGRFLLAHGVRRALVVSSFPQSFYFGVPWLSTFHARCRVELGFEVGQLRWRGPHATELEPDPAVFRRGSDPRDP